MPRSVTPGRGVRRHALAVLAAVVGLLALTAAPTNGAAQASAGALRVVVRADGRAVQGATVQLLKAGVAPGTADLLRTATSGVLGEATFRVPPGVRRADVLYLTAHGGSIAGSPLPATVELATSLADLRAGAFVVNELTTVAAGYSLAQFAVAGAVGGPSPGMPNAATMPRNLVDLATGQIAPFLGTAPNGGETETLASFDSLASIIAGCAAGTNDCDAFLTAATDAWGTRPQTTWQAMTLLPKNPSGDSEGVFDQVPANPRFQPVRTSKPAAWVLALRFYGNGHQFNGPGNIAFDAQGRVWANNNAQWSPVPKGVCPGREIFRLDPYHRGRPIDTFRGGGLDGAGFGIALDPNRHVWVANFGFTGSECPLTPRSNSVSELSLDGRPLSPRVVGYTDGPLSWPQGIKSDVGGNVWIGSCGSNTLVEYPNGQHQLATVVGTGISRAFDVAQNALGNIFVTANGGDEVFAFGPDGRQLPQSPYGDSTIFSKPLGAASDSLGNVWVSNSGVIDIPCQPGATLQVPGPDVQLSGTIAQVGPDGSLARYAGGGMTIPWGIAVDGDDNLWVANFSGERLSHLCGARLSTCPKGVAGAPLSPPDAGYAFDGLQRNTGVQVDPSGNVWLTNNWIKVPVQTDPFGDGLVAYLGMAAPVKAPLIGTPHP